MHPISKAIHDIKNWTASVLPDRSKSASNLNRYTAPVGLQRLSHDVSMWRTAIREAEAPFMPYRVKMQQMFIDTILNGHVTSVIERRKDLTLLRDFKICNPAGDEDENITKLLQAEWFSLFMSYALDAQFFGYSLISLGDCINDEFPEVDIIKRWHISPDRLNVGSYPYMPSGIEFSKDPYRVSHVWVPTPSETGSSKCGFGLLYKIGLYEIFLRNTLGYNGDYVELFAQPFRLAKTTKTNEQERAELQAAMQNLGSAGWAIMDNMDEFEFLKGDSAGTGWKSYENFEIRLQKTISKIVLGHADALDSTPGKLGAGQGEEKSPTAVALSDKQVKDGRFIQSVVNKELLPRMREMGFSIPDDYCFEFKNDQELEEFRQREDQSNKMTADIAVAMKNANLEMDAKYFEERTGIPTKKVEPPPMPAPGQPRPGAKPLKPGTKNKLNNLYK